MKNSKDNYWHVSILSNTAKIYQKSSSFKKISEYFESFLSKCKCSFRKRFSGQQSPLSMLKKWKSAIDNKQTFGALLTDLCLLHDILIAKLNAYRNLAKRL